MVNSNQQVSESYSRTFSQVLENLRRNTLLAANSISHSSSRQGDLKNEDEEINGEENVEPRILTYKKGHPFYLVNSEDLIPKFWYLENFQADDYCFFKPDILETKLVKKGWSSEAIQLCIILIHNTISFCVDKKFGNRMGVAAMQIIYQAFDFLMWNMYAKLADLHKFFREVILLYAVDDLPTSMAIYTPIECFVMAQYFAMQFDSIFLLLKAVAIPSFMVKIAVEEH